MADQSEMTPEEFIASLPKDVQARVKLLQDLQQTKEGHEADYRKELAVLEEKYEQLYAPLYEERSEIVAGSKAVEGVSGEDNGIPDFWYRVLTNCEAIKLMISEKDSEVLAFLKDIKSENLMNDGMPCGFRLKFFFRENPFFTNEVLEKTYHMLAEDEGVLEKTEGTKIVWKTGKDVTIKLMKKKPKKGSRPDAKPQMKTEKIDSFFNFFDPPPVPKEEDEIDEDQMEEIQARIEGDYELGAIIREKLVPDAVAWYTGEAALLDDDEGGFEFGPDDEDEDEDEDGDEDKDDQQAAGAANGEAAEGQKPPECKQQ